MEYTEIDLENHLLRLCTAVGGYEISLDPNNDTEKYQIGDEGVECLRDIKKLLRIDDQSETKHLFRLLGEWQFLKTDLIPIMKQYKNSNKILVAVIEILVPLTWPIDSLTNNQVFMYFQKQYLGKYKELLSDSEILKILFEMVTQPLSKSKNERTQREEDTIRLILYLLRNLLMIREEEGWKVSDEGNVLLKRMEECHLLEMILALASSSGEGEYQIWNSITMELIFCIFSLYDVELLFTGGGTKDSTTTTTTGDSTTSNNKENRNTSTSIKVQPIINQIGSSRATTRPPSFKGKFITTIGNQRTFVENCHDSITEILHSTQKGKKHFQPRGKKYKHPTLSQNQLHLQQQEIQQQSGVGNGCMRIGERTTRVMRKFICEFLECGYNTLCGVVFKGVLRERDDFTEGDLLRFLRVNCYILTFACLYSERVCSAGSGSGGSTEESAGEGEFDWGLVLSGVDKKYIGFLLRKIIQYNHEGNELFLRHTLNALSATLQTIQSLTHSSNTQYQSFSKGIQTLVYYHAEYIYEFPKLLKDPLYYDVGFLECVFRCSWILVRGLEVYSRGEREVFVRRKKRGHCGGGSSGSNKEGSVEDSEEERYDISNPTNEQQYTESLFDYQQFLYLYTTESTIHSLLVLLRHHERLKGETLLWMVKFMYRLCVGCAMDSIFYGIEFLGVCSDLLSKEKEVLIKYSINTMSTNSTNNISSTSTEGSGMSTDSSTNGIKRKAYQELYRFMKYLSGLFIKRLTRYPLLILEVFYPKQKRDCFRIQYGLDSIPADDTTYTSNTTAGVGALTAVGVGVSGGGDKVETVGLETSVSWEMGIDYYVVYLKKLGFKSMVECLIEKLEFCILYFESVSGGGISGDSGSEMRKFVYIPDSEEERVWLRNPYVKGLLGHIYMRHSTNTITTTTTTNNNNTNPPTDTTDNTTTSKSNNEGDVEWWWSLENQLLSDLEYCLEILKNALMKEESELGLGKPLFRYFRRKMKRGVVTTADDSESGQSEGDRAGDRSDLDNEGEGKKKRRRKKRLITGTGTSAGTTEEEETGSSTMKKELSAEIVVESTDDEADLEMVRIYRERTMPSWSVVFQ